MFMALLGGVCGAAAVVIGIICKQTIARSRASTAWAAEKVEP
jgi:hypothetical protein